MAKNELNGNNEKINIIQRSDKKLNQKLHVCLVWALSIFLESDREEWKLKRGRKRTDS